MAAHTQHREIKLDLNWKFSTSWPPSIQVEGAMQASTGEKPSLVLLTGKPYGIILTCQAMSKQRVTVFFVKKWSFSCHVYGYMAMMYPLIE